MTQEEKQLLIKDISARLPYGVKIKFSSPLNGQDVVEKLRDVEFRGENILLSTTTWYSIELNECKPYLRPMSSMTEEEREELSDYLCEKVMSNKIGITIPPNPTQGKGIPFIWMGDCLDWLNAHHFDYRGLIPMGLALKAPEGMYNIK